MTLFALSGYIQPYKTSTSNHLNLVIMMSLMLLLMLRANPYLQDDLNTVPRSNGTTLTHIPPCDSDDVVVTPFSILLAAVYYLPLLMAIIALILKILYIL